MPIDYSKYPPNWNEIRARILKRADNKCEFCGVNNYAVGYRNGKGNFVELFGMEQEIAVADGLKTIQIVLTIAHLDHDEENWEVNDERLRALCQKCHLEYDIPEKQRRQREKKAVGDLFQ